jgi:hypothetical protein
VPGVHKFVIVPGTEGSIGAQLWSLYRNADRKQECKEWVNLNRDALSGENRDDDFFVPPEEQEAQRMLTVKKTLIYSSALLLVGVLIIYMVVAGCGILNIILIGTIRNSNSNFKLMKLIH